VSPPGRPKGEREPERDSAKGGLASDPIAAFDAYGIELEYAIVDRDTLDVAPIAATLLEAMPAHTRSDGVRVGWSNEIVAHVAELKNAEPVTELDRLTPAFEDEIRAANASLSAMNARLLPTGMHPWMDPSTETVLWTRSDADIYGAYDRIFDCRRHGWSNVQSMHVNLPFADDAEFARLHAAVRLVLPMVPALCASSPFVDGRIAGERDHRLAVYRTHAARVPQIVGKIVPEPCASRAAYESEVLEPIYESMAAHDPRGTLRREWINARGAIARFDRNAIEIRLADTQECPRADIAAAHAICAVVRALYERQPPGAAGHGVSTESLAALVARATREGEEAVAEEPFLRAIGLSGVRACTLRDAWRRLLDRVAGGAPDWGGVVDVILDRGTLATRILRATGRNPTRERLREVYGELAGCLEEGRLFG
jgi:gamma-glutamyl:cysteine ligase YbdK (ATP-grasp superfamily)